MCPPRIACPCCDLTNDIFRSRCCFFFSVWRCFLLLKKKKDCTHSGPRRSFSAPTHGEKSVPSTFRTDFLQKHKNKNSTTRLHFSCFISITPVFFFFHPRSSHISQFDNGAVCHYFILTSNVFFFPCFFSFFLVIFLLFLLFSSVHLFFLAFPCGRSALHSTMTTNLFVFFPQLNARLKLNGILRMECLKKKKSAQMSSFPFLFTRCLVPCCSFGFCFLTSKNVRCPFSVTVFLFRCMVVFLRFHRRF